MRIRLALAGAVVSGLCLGTGCTPSQTVTSPPPTATTPTSTATTPTPTASSTLTSTPTPTESWDPQQAAAVAAVRGFAKVSAEIGADPSRFTEAQMTRRFKEYIGGEMIAPNVGSFMSLRKKGYRESGQMVERSLDVTDVVDNHSSRGLEVHVTVCQDQTELSIVDRAGQIVAAEQPPAFNLRQYSVRKPQKESRWRVFGMTTVKGDCGQ